MFLFYHRDLSDVEKQETSVLSPGITMFDGKLKTENSL